MIGILILSILGYLILGTALSILAFTYFNDDIDEVIEQDYVNFNGIMSRKVIRILIMMRAVILYPIWMIEELVNRVC